MKAMMQKTKKQQYAKRMGRPRIAVQDRTGRMAMIINDYFERGGTARDLARDAGICEVTLWRWYSTGDPGSVSIARRILQVARSKGCTIQF